jgi:two-component system, sensor histidine kinase PdtaS
VSTLSELVREHTDLGADDVEALHALVAEWHLLADLSLADLLLWVPLRPGLDPRGRGRLVAVAQVRPATAPTCYRRDLVGDVVDTEEKWLLGRAFRERRILRIGDPEWVDGAPVRAEAVPVVLGRRTVAVLGRDTNLTASRRAGQLERAYRRSSADLARMVSEGTFPASGVPVDPETAPRVGDGLIRLDAEGTVGFASPNALSAYRRLGLTGNLIGADLDSVTRLLLDDDGDDPRLGETLRSGRPAEAEIASQGSVVRFRAVPLLPGGSCIGALVLLRDVTEVRRRDRALQGKDATIREIHHRVKNNLQTVAALLRLQARRLESPEARAALEESVRRVSSIALVHERLSETLEGLVDFDVIADRVTAMVAEVAAGLPGDGAGLTMRREGRAGELPAEVATPLAMVLTELLQNALEHGRGDPGTAGEVVLRVERSAAGLRLEVVDDGAGLPAGFLLEESPRLGLQIVRTLVSDIGGSISLRDRDGGGTLAAVSVPLDATAAEGPA